MILEEEGDGLQRRLEGKTVGTDRRHRPRELFIEFTGGTRLFVDMLDETLDFSVTGGAP